MSDPLSGRVALVTGASGGIGSALAMRLAQAGSDLVLAYGRHGQDAERVAERARALGVRVLTVGADMADAAAVVGLADAAVAEFGAVDVLVANAGSAPQTSWEDVDLDLWNTTLAINLTAPFLLTQRLLPAMVQRSFGRVLFVSSVAALHGGVVGPHYSAGKAGLHGLTYHLAPRVAAHGVTVNVIAPALVSQTRMLPTAPDGGMAVPIPVGRIGEPDEVAEMSIAILRNGYLTNKVITVDGGLIPR